jgi:hypothetical protein
LLTRQQRQTLCVPPLRFKLALFRPWIERHGKKVLVVPLLLLCHRIVAEQWIDDFIAKLTSKDLPKAYHRLLHWIVWGWYVLHKNLQS